MEIVTLLASSFYLVMMSLLFFKFKKCSKFYVFFLASEYFYILGLGIYPILLSLGVFNINEAYKTYSNISDISYLTPIHIAFYALGAFLGGSSISASKYFSEKAVFISKFFYVNPSLIFIYLSILVFIPFLFLVSSFGLIEFITSSGLRRSGNFDFSEGLGGLSFLTKFMTLGLLIIVVYPYYVLKEKSVFRVSVVIATCGLLVYLATVSRYALFQSFVLLFAVYWSYHSKKISVNIFALFLIFFVPLVLLYGKSFVSVLAAFLSGQQELEIESSVDFSNIMMSFGHLFYSIDAGIRNFFSSGSFIAKDIVLSPLGIFPSGFFDKIGLSNLSYQLIDDIDRSSCINTNLLGVENECYVPPYYTGISAYIMPVFGGFIFGYIRFLMYSSISRAWHVLENKSESIKYIPILITVFFFIEQLMLFIPNVISLMMLLFLSILFFRFLALSSRAY